jgi:NaMN:DMB phosphoribosyltransferase
LAADLDFEPSTYPGLRIYETGLVKEGVGAGGASIAAMAKSGVTKDQLLKEIERNYASLMSLK